MGSWFSSCPVTGTPEQPSSIDHLTDEDLYGLIQERNDQSAFSPSNEPDSSLFTNTVWRITSDAVAKRTRSPTEAFMTSYISSHTSIPIPKIRRILPDDPSKPNCKTWWIVMDLIDGEVLLDAWKAMSIWRKLCAMWSVRRYIRELRKTPLPNPDVPGPFDASGMSYPCHGYFFTEDGAGPFNSYAEMATWFDRRRFCVQVISHGEEGIMLNCPKFDASHPLVLCHMDLHMRNFVIDKNGKLWVLDWANAGAFPPWLEYAQMVCWGSPLVRSAARAPEVWISFARFMVGDYRKYKTGYLDKLRWAFDRPAGDYFPFDYFERLGLKVD